MSLDNAPAGKREAAAERRVKSLELRKMGWSYRRIGKALGVAGKTAFQDVRDALEALRQEQDGLAEDILALELERLDDMLVTALKQAIGGRLEAIDRVLRIMDRRARFLGTDAPSKIAPTDPTGKVPYEGRLTDVERIDRIVALLDSARARRDERAGAGGEQQPRKNRNKKRPD